MASDQESQLPDWLEEHWREAVRRGLSNQGWLLVVESSFQTMFVVRAGKLKSEHRISTSRIGLGEVNDSNRTPRGMHEIADRIGGKQPPGAAFKSRALTGCVLGTHKWNAEADNEMILTRILRLRGLEPGLNTGAGIDSYDRHIYIHGTNQEQLLGRPASHGCIRMANLEIVTLFDRIGQAPAWCEIL